MQNLKVTSTAFVHKGEIPIQYTGWGKDISPELILDNLDEKAISIAIIMDDLDHPISMLVNRDYNHWLIWNIPAQKVVPENITHGKQVKELEGAIQGLAYGKYRYAGPKPPRFLKKAHRYGFHVYVLDRMLDLKAEVKKKEFLEIIKPYVLQTGYLEGYYQNKK
ncbi:Raf kinase inhibitor-like YbhB/YbcL family protein [Breznakia sp. PF5-3]|uniref:YbhB/YbcL family Raf kinase inhibitor-like protein n=1 Tax=unclassified Breznakia TaxID=2623764 RepID=UPI0024058477|nr:MULTISPECIES: YbhB/YbcL family Raf kinase inhibitor-like protein [unclassified Breznakia]MDF9825208.1 Raf kinase inhibitor-like YbhB/YbcL family protein [Breznakia sp. PM6-1]MDF9836089.1 Raf kinase inhibitor-like YbhB/YbcL family protein [Breznakia sp. PF5-3]MDF9838655.1 Raf kinase inhibitor-like YbhB/YbcL family protein [Breznakia sp. PFB2-8]MDF9860686.1 Raf kinase inhibitor-like YbhB/YbcL family protein [Breznakia sp. PH5-24]